MTDGGFPGWMTDTAALYARAFRRGAALALRNWPVGLVVVGYGALLVVVGFLSAPLGFVGGVLVYVASVACASSWLSLVAQVIRSGRVRFADLPAGFTAYLGDLLAVGFFLWLLSMVDALVLGPFPLVHIVFVLATFVFLNAVPELVYLGRHPAAELLVESYRFIGENWIEWFPPQFVLAACIAAAAVLLPAGPYGLVANAAVGVVLYFAMIVRGLLFVELSTSSRRARAFQRRAGG